MITFSNDFKPEENLQTLKEIGYDRIVLHSPGPYGTLTTICYALKVNEEYEKLNEYEWVIPIEVGIK